MKSSQPGAFDANSWAIYSGENGTIGMHGYPVARCVRLVCLHGFFRCGRSYGIPKHASKSIRNLPDGFHSEMTCSLFGVGHFIGLEHQKRTRDCPFSSGHDGFSLAFYSGRRDWTWPWCLGKATGEEPGICALMVTKCNSKKRNRQAREQNELEKLGVQKIILT